MPVSAVANPARGTTLALGSGGMTPTYTNLVALVTDISGPKQKVKTRDTTVLVATATSLAAAIADNADGVSGSLLLDPQSDSHLALQALMTTPPAVNPTWRMTFNDTVNGVTTATFSGVLSEFSVGDLTVEGNLPADFTISVSGVLTWAKSS